MRVIDETTSKMHFDPKAKPKGMLRIVLAMKNSVRACPSGNPHIQFISQLRHGVLFC